jgi:hypothetical protein
MSIAEIHPCHQVQPWSGPSHHTARQDDITKMATSPKEDKALYNTINAKLGEIMEKAEETCASPWK